jgi:hypothetical protein
MATYKVYFANEGVPASGLTLAWETLKKVSNGTDESSAPSFTETGGGWYKFSYSPTEDMVGVIDGSATLTVDADRYVPVDFSANDTAITETRLSELDAANLPAVADTIAADVVNIDGDPMRGTNNAALASVCTETRLAELDAVNLPAVTDTIAADVVDIATDYTSARAAKLDNLDQALSTTESNIRGVDSDTLETLSDQLDTVSTFDATTDAVDLNADQSSVTIGSVDSAVDANVTQIGGSATVDGVSIAAWAKKIFVAVIRPFTSDSSTGEIVYEDSTGATEFTHTIEIDETDPTIKTRSLS